MIERLGPALRRWQTWGWLLLAVGIAYLAYLLVTGLLTPAEPTTPTDTQMIMRNIAAQGQHGHNGWQFDAKSSEISPDGYTTTYHGVHDATFFRDGKPAYKLQATMVTVDSRNQNYSASGGVHVHSTSPTLPEDLQTENTYWDQADQTLTCPTPTRFVYHETIMHTTHMTVNLKTGASQLGDTSIDYAKPPASQGPASPSPAVSARPIPPL